MSELIFLSKEQDEKIVLCKKHVQSIEEFLKEPIENGLENITLIQDRLGKAINLQSSTAFIMGTATEVLGAAKGLAGDAIMRRTDLGAIKNDTMRLLVAGYLSKYEGFYARAERSVKSIDKYIDGLRSILSSEKSQYEKSSHTN